MDKKGWILVTAITAALISIFFAQNKKIEILRLQIDESNQELKKIKDEIGTANSEMEAKKKELLKITYHLELERKAYAEKSKLLSEELKQADSTVFANETLLFGDRTPVVDSSVPTDILSTITSCSKLWRRTMRQNSLNWIKRAF
ncbi:hypothetical protein M3194_05300 [Paenibacillus glycanilyticus]|uniref:hypothetical protein n=1 Tax=Paenibacillus glycanilyticus TaxID=126569 RepID=UPI002040BB1B|nr:hypothetical protein [Paenibacillus glycanilyticus]MCM3626774.1 hypothetical protein [Paenibacillus glycanilyticus]